MIIGTMATARTANETITTIIIVAVLPLPLPGKYSVKNEVSTTSSSINSFLRWEITSMFIYVFKMKTTVSLNG